MEELKESLNRQQERFQREKEAAVLAARVEAQVAALGNEGNAGDSTLQQIDTDNQKKVKTNLNRHLSGVLTYILFHSAPIVTEKHWPNVLYVDVRHIVPHSVNVKIGLATRWSAWGA